MAWAREKRTGCLRTLGVRRTRPIWDSGPTQRRPLPPRVARPGRMKSRCSRRMGKVWGCRLAFRGEGNQRHQKKKIIKGGRAPTMSFMAKPRLWRVGRRTKDGKLTEAGNAEPDRYSTREKSRRHLTPRDMALSKWTSVTRWIGASRRHESLLISTASDNTCHTYLTSWRLAEGVMD